jgi:hypothetical protein
MNVDDTEDLKPAMQASAATSEADDTLTGNQYPPSLKLAVQLTFSMLSHTLMNPTHKA